MTSDKAGTGYWQDVWLREAPEPVDLEDKRLGNHMNLVLGRFFSHYLPQAGPGGIFLEAGCGGSAWLPVFGRRFGYRVRGLDYSEQGCALARTVLHKAGVEGEVLRADLFAPPPELHQQADVVYSIGLVEHFTPTSGVVERLAWLLKPGGLALTLVPNMRGLPGFAQRHLDRRVYDLHVPLSPLSLEEAHLACGLLPVASGHLGTFNLGVVNAARWSGRPLLRRLLSLTMSSASMAVWLLERVLGAERPSALASPLVFCVARKPAPPADGTRAADPGT